MATAESAVAAASAAAYSASFVAPLRTRRRRGPRARRAAAPNATTFSRLAPTAARLRRLLAIAVQRRRIEVRVLHLGDAHERRTRDATNSSFFPRATRTPGHRQRRARPVDGRAVASAVTSPTPRTLRPPGSSSAHRRGAETRRFGAWPRPTGASASRRASERLGGSIAARRRQRQGSAGHAACAPSRSAPFVCVPHASASSAPFEQQYAPSAGDAANRREPAVVASVAGRARARRRDPPRRGRPGSCDTALITVHPGGDARAGAARASFACAIWLEVVKELVEQQQRRPSRRPHAPARARARSSPEAMGAADVRAQPVGRACTNASRRPATSERVLPPGRRPLWWRPTTTFCSIVPSKMPGVRSADERDADGDDARSRRDRAATRHRASTAPPLLRSPARRAPRPASTRRRLPGRRVGCQRAHQAPRGASQPRTAGSTAPA